LLFAFLRGPARKRTVTMDATGEAAAREIDDTKKNIRNLQATGGMKEKRD
jgi:hypothetical protein